VGETTGIAWTDSTWNPVRGCSKVSAGCKNCYAETFAERWRGVPGHAFEQGFDLRLVPEAIDLPLRWKKPRRIFVNSMSDVFHEAVPFEYVARIFAVMQLAQHHTFQVLTKRAARMAEFFQWLDTNEGRAAWLRAVVTIPTGGKEGWSTAWPFRNVWLGVSVEDQRAADERIPELLATPAAVRFLSCEPLLGPVNIDTYLGPLPEDGDGAPYPGSIGWVIVGGESGPSARPCNVAHVRRLAQQCLDAGTPVFVKQLGANPIMEPGPLTWPCVDRAGRDPAEWPVDLRVQQFPEVQP
jgi:protein gp37